MNENKPFDNDNHVIEMPAKQSLDQLIEILDEDSLRNIAGGTAVRPKGVVAE